MAERLEIVESEDETGFICALCREWVDPADPNVLRAFEIKHVQTFGGRTPIEGLASYFHHEHFPGGSSWRLDQERADLNSP
jgi:hypothetical protein